MLKRPAALSALVMLGALQLGPGRAQMLESRVHVWLRRWQRTHIDGCYRNDQKQGASECFHNADAAAARHQLK